MLPLSECARNFINKKLVTLPVTFAIYFRGFFYVNIILMHVLCTVCILLQYSILKGVKNCRIQVSFMIEFPGRFFPTLSFASYKSLK